MDALDLHRTAHLYMDMHGIDAVFEAAAMADELFDKGDYAGQRAWIRVMKILEKWQAIEAGESERVH